ncbi:asparagine synthase-related protein [Emticicia sp. 21SJ11W-3]|uniref:asparagine synthase-related protein n=1 Tax=Emticicia sp. 21SJ11W-3 TaxID=2916755 RepID=UPI00209C7101|nr:asparagine synthase-related protein [Emticicia sp. 21SJ11W-3]UTA68938.1 asparagine synthase-related protein [Emticicia sp. 21SJ11W-3]
MNVSEIGLNMYQAMNFFRGDAEGVYQSDEIYICNKFLFNTPESFNASAIVQNDRYVLAASCRIDNREKLASELKIKDPLKASDHEFILAAYTFYQNDCVKHLIGDFAFVVWDKQQKALFMARDHLGVKPLFYTCQQNLILFSSDLNAFLHLPFIDLSYKKSYVAGLLHGSYILKYLNVKHTCYHDIYRLEPSHYLFYFNERVQITKYWELKPCFPEKPVDAALVYREFYQLFFEAVRCRLRGIESFGVGLELSGGLDSSTIACMANEVLSAKKTLFENLYSFSLVQSDEGRVLAEKEIVEEEHIQNQLLDSFGFNKKNIFKLNRHPFTNYQDELQETIRVHGGLNKQNTTWQNAIYEAMQSAGCRVKLSGFSGDELVTDYGTRWMYDIWYSCRPGRVMKELLKFDIAVYKSLFRYLQGRLFGFKMNKASIAKEIDSDFLKAERLKDLPAKEYGIDVKSYKHFMISRIMRPFTSLRFESENLHALRANSECRYPMADIRLLEYMIQLPAEMFRPGDVKRNFIRKSLQSILPAYVICRDDKTAAVIPYRKLKNKVFISQLLKDGLPADMESNMVDTKKILERLKTPENLKRETDVISLLTAAYLVKTEHQYHLR